MTSTLNGLILFADRSIIFREMGNGFREKRESFNPSDLLWWVFAAVAILVAFAVIAKLLAKQDKRRQYNNPAALFRELCQVHNLDRASRNLLKTIARHQELTTPAHLFVDPDRLIAALREDSLRPQLPAIQSLRNKLFAASE